MNTNRWPSALRGLAQRLGGRVRQKFDAERSRKAACKAISPAIEAIEKVPPQLGPYPHKSINLGLEVSYNSDVVIDWLFQSPCFELSAFKCIQAQSTILDSSHMDYAFEIDVGTQ